MKLLAAISTTLVFGVSLISPKPVQAFASTCKADGFGGRICVMGDGSKVQVNNNPARSSNYTKALENEQKRR
jgi:hypothetical protein|tara:strand:- start:449 stop:664 length:216 start_codon:yes stop_codon:yes gene_type:complete